MKKRRSLLALAVLAGWSGALARAAPPSDAGAAHAEGGAPGCFMTLSGGTVGTFPCIVIASGAHTDAGPDAVWVELYDSWGPDAHAPERVSVRFFSSAWIGLFGQGKVTSAGRVEWHAVSPSVGSFTFQPSVVRFAKDGGVPEVHGVLDATLVISNLGPSTPDVQLHVVF